MWERAGRAVMALLVRGSGKSLLDESSRAVRSKMTTAYRAR